MEALSCRQQLRLLLPPSKHCSVGAWLRQLVLCVAVQGFPKKGNLTTDSAEICAGWYFFSLFVKISF